MPTGYSKTPLAAKLGIKEGGAVALINAPRRYEESLGKLPKDVKVSRGPRAGVDLVQLFAKDKSTLERDLPSLRAMIRENGAIWVSWTKRASKLETDLDESAVRSAGLGLGLVDVKICAVDETWSGLKFVVRVRDRG